MNARGITFQCASCRALVVASTIVVEDNGARAGVQCDACGAMTYVPTNRGDARTGPTVVVDAAAAARANPPDRALPAATALAPTSTTTPATRTMAATRETAMSASWSSDARTKIEARILKLGQLPDQEALAADFEVLLGKWDVDGEHSKFLKKAAMVDQLAFAGQRYRAVLEAVPNDAAAKKAQNDIMSLAMATFATKKDVASLEKDRGRTAQIVAVVVFAVVALIAAIFVVPKLLPPVDGGATMGNQP